MHYIQLQHVHNLKLKSLTLKLTHKNFKNVLTRNDSVKRFYFPKLDHFFKSYGYIGPTHPLMTKLTLFKVDSLMFCIELSEISTCVEIGNRCHFDIIIPRESEVVLKVALKKATCAISTKQQHLQSASGHS